MLMKIRLGYVAISLTLNLTASKTINYTNYQKINNQHSKLDDLINQNFNNLNKILYFNFKNNIHFYRLSQNIIPLATHPNVNFDYIKSYQKKWENIGILTKLYNIRIDTHPDQFCILNSPKKEIVKSSIEILKFHKKIFKAMKVDGKAIIHIGGCYKDKETSLQRFIKNFNKLDKGLQKIIILENDDKIFNIKDTLYVCETLKIPMVLDYHHFKCNNENENIRDYLTRIINTWKNEKLHPKMHFSSPKNKKEFRNHSTYIICSDFIEFLEIIEKFDTDIDIMLECKGKDEALFRLTRQLKTETNYIFLDETTIEISKKKRLKIQSF